MAEEAEVVVVPALFDVPETAAACDWECVFGAAVVEALPDAAVLVAGGVPVDVVPEALDGAVEVVLPVVVVPVPVLPDDDVEVSVVVVLPVVVVPVPVPLDGAVEAGGVVVLPVVVVPVPVPLDGAVEAGGVVVPPVDVVPVPVPLDGAVEAGGVVVPPVDVVPVPVPLDGAVVDEPPSESELSAAVTVLATVLVTLVI